MQEGDSFTVKVTKVTKEKAGDVYYTFGSDLFLASCEVTLGAKKYYEELPFQDFSLMEDFIAILIGDMKDLLKNGGK